MKLQQFYNLHNNIKCQTYIKIIFGCFPFTKRTFTNKIIKEHFKSIPAIVESTLNTLNKCQQSSKDKH